MYLMLVLPSDWFPVDVNPSDLSLTPARNWEEPFRTFVVSFSHQWIRALLCSMPVLCGILFGNLFKHDMTLSAARTRGC